MKFNITFAKEDFDKVWPEMEPLTEEQWKEVPNIGGGDNPNTDYKAYKALQDTGLLLVYTIRYDGSLIGYCVFTLVPMMQTTGSLAAKNVTLYLKPEYRGGEIAPAFLQAIEEDLKYDEGVDRIDYQFKPYKIPATLMETLGYAASEVVYSKVLEA